MSAVGLYLEDGTSWPGVSVGAPGAAVGEAVFTTAMTGYQEALTDPSFARQLLTFTAPMIGNYGIEDASSESRRVQATALICHEARNYKPQRPRGPARLAARRRRRRRSRASTRARWCATCAIAARCSASPAARASAADEALELLAAEPPMAGRLLAGEVSGELDGLPDDGRGAATWWCSTTAPRPRSCACWSRPVPSSRSLPARRDRGADVDALAPDGVLLANGPGDPGSMDAHVAEVRAMVDQGPAAVRHLPRPPVARPRARAGDVQAAASAIAAPTTRCSRAHRAACS